MGDEGEEYAGEEEILGDEEAGDGGAGGPDYAAEGTAHGERLQAMNAAATSDIGVVVDIGSGFTKAGLQSDDAPTCIIPSIVGHPRPRYATYYDGSPHFVGHEAVEERSRLSFTHPVDHGHVDDMLEIEELLNYVFYRRLEVEPSSKALLLTEPSLCSQKHRERMAELCFEVYDVPELNLAIQGIMSLYATGRTTGLVVEIGDGVTQIVPVYEGYADKSAVRRSDFGGQEVSMHLQRMLCENYMLTTRDDMEHVRMIKETVCYCALDPSEEEERDDIYASYELPDGMTLRDNATTSVQLGVERFKAVEALFDPSLMHRDNPPIIDLIWKSIHASAMETRKSLLNSVVLSGGTTLFQGLPERIEKEIRVAAPPQAWNHVRVIADPGRLFGVWMGAKLFCGLRAMQTTVWTSKQEWEDEGSNVVHKKVQLK
eukprot:GHVN01044433.1.p1 GENE.GHVN01044433.1~~GHVN01044433.1.p1  ORF type:complete len:429 (+),score=84.92 GHVN01044433.1:367-1653(+)